MRYLLTAGLLTMCLAAGSGQNVETQNANISDTLIAEIKSKADSIAIEAAAQIDSILESKKVFPGREDTIFNQPTGQFYRYIWYYRIVDGDSVFVQIKINRVK